MKYNRLVKTTLIFFILATPSLAIAKAGFDAWGMTDSSRNQENYAWTGTAHPLTQTSWSVHNNSVGGAIQSITQTVTGVNSQQAQATAAANGLFQPPPASIPGVTGQNNCDDIERIVNQSASDSLLARMPDSTPNQALSDAGVFETMSKKVSFLGDLIGGLFDFISSGNFFSGMDGKLNIVADKAFNSIGSQLTSKLFDTAVKTATNAAVSTVNQGVNEAIRDINGTVPTSVTRPIANTVTNATTAVIHDAGTAIQQQNPFNQPQPLPSSPTLPEQPKW